MHLKTNKNKTGREEENGVVKSIPYLYIFILPFHPKVFHTVISTISHRERQHQHISYIFTVILFYQLHRFCLMTNGIEYELMRFKIGSKFVQQKVFQ